MTACILIRKTASQKDAFLHIFNTTKMSLFILITTLLLIRIIFFLAKFVHTNKEFDFLQLVLAWQTFFPGYVKPSTGVEDISALKETPSTCFV